VKVAVATADQSLSSPFGKQWPQPRQHGDRLAFQIGYRFRREQRGMLAKDRAVVADELFECCDPRPAVHGFGAFVHRRHRDGEFAEKRVVEFAALRQVIEGSILVEADHFHRPFNWLADPVQGERAVAFARDRHDPAIELRRKSAVDLELGLAGGLALSERGIVEERIADGAFDL
jgi:hypothetical protein